MTAVTTRIPRRTFCDGIFPNVLRLRGTKQSTLRKGEKQLPERYDGGSLSSRSNQEVPNHQDRCNFSSNSFVPCFKTISCHSASFQFRLFALPKPMRSSTSFSTRPECPNFMAWHFNATRCRSETILIVPSPLRATKLSADIFSKVSGLDSIKSTGIVFWSRLSNCRKVGPAEIFFSPNSSNKSIHLI